MDESGEQSGHAASSRSRWSPISRLRPHATVDVADAMWKVVDEMKTKGRGAVLVVEDGALVGIFTERDLRQPRRSHRRAVVARGRAAT